MKQKTLSQLIKSLKEERKELRDYQMGKLNEFKRWIYKNRGGKETNPILSALKEVFISAKIKCPKK